MKMDFAPPLNAVQACSVQPLEDNSGERAPLVRQVSLDEERGCSGHWRGGGSSGSDGERGVRLLRALLLAVLRQQSVPIPPCAVLPANPDPKGWWWYWRDARALERAARRFANTTSRAALRRRAASIPLDSLDSLAFQDILQEICQECRSVEERALSVLLFLCDVCARAAGSRAGGFCRAAGWAAAHVRNVATPWALRHGGWGCVMRRAAGPEDVAALRALAGAAAAALLAIAIYCRLRVRVRVP